LLYRKNYSQTLETVNQAIQHALSDHADKSPHETAAKEIEGLRRNWEASNHGGNFSDGASGAVILDLKNAPRVAENLGQTVPDYLTHLMSQNSKRASLWLEHATPKVGGVK